MNIYETITEKANSNTFKTGEAAQYLNISIDTLKRWDKNGKLTAHRTTSNRRYYTQSQLDDFIVNHNLDKDKNYYLNKYTCPVKYAPIQNVKPEQIIGRDNEAHKLVTLLNAKPYHKAFLISCHGSDGKRSLVKRTDQIDAKHKYCYINNSLFYDTLNAPNTYITMQLIFNIVKRAKEKHIILVFDEYAHIMQLCPDLSIIILDTLNSLNTPAIFMDILNSYTRFIQRISPIYREVPVLKLNQLPKNTIIKIMQNHVARWTENTKVEDPDLFYNYIYQRALLKANDDSVLRHAMIILDNTIGYYRAIKINSALDCTQRDVRLNKNLIDLANANNF